MRDIAKVTFAVDVTGKDYITMRDVAEQFSDETQVIWKRGYVGYETHSRLDSMENCYHVPEELLEENKVFVNGYNVP